MTTTTMELPVIESDQCTLEYVPIEKMAVDPQYQRTLDKRRTAKLAETWNPLAVGVLYVSRRGPRYYIIDGQHRWQAAVARGESTLPCLVLSRLSAQTEAALFVYFNHNRRIASSLDVFRARHAQGETTARQITKVLDMHGLAVGGQFRAVGTARKIHERFGWEVLAAILGTTLRAWPNDVKGATDSHIMLGLAALYSYYGAQQFDFAHMEKALRTTTRDDIIRSAAARKITSAATGWRLLARCAGVMLELYNANLGGRSSQRLAAPASYAAFSQASGSYTHDDGGLAAANQ